MPDFPKLPIITPPPNSFPQLPIVTPDPPRLSLQEKYGSFYYMGIAGLAITLAIVGRFAYGAWTTRAIWVAFYKLHDPSRPLAQRVQSAWLIGRSPDVNDKQRLDVALRKELPPIARYIVAEGLTAGSIQADPKAYAVMVAKSEGWPDWLRLLMARPMAYGVGQGYRIAWEPLDLLRENPDPAIVLWATYTRAAMGPGDPATTLALSESARTEGPYQPLAILLEQAVKAEGESRVRKLDEATVWLRTHHPQARTLWEGWDERDGKLVQDSNATQSEGSR